MRKRPNAQGAVVDGSEASADTGDTQAREHRAKVAEARRLFFEFYRPLQTQASEMEREFLATGEDLELEFGGAPLVARAWGQGPLLLFFHGLLGRGAQFRFFVERAVLRGFRAVVFDVPGNGGSVATAIHGDQMLYTLDRIVEAERMTPHAMIAHSLGCSWALYATRNGLTPQRLVCISPIGFRDLALERFAQMHRIPPDIDAMLRRMFEGFEGGDICELYDPVAAVERLHIAGLVIHGVADDFVGPENGQLLAKSWSGADLLLVPGRNHFDILADSMVVEASVDFAARG